MTDRRDLTDRALGAFLMQFAADRERDTVRPLSEYLRRFPSHEVEIAQEYLTLTDADLQVAGSAAGPADPAEDPAAGPRADPRARAGAAGKRFGPYQIEAPLGRGGQATVYRAVDTRIGREVALKVLHMPLGPTSTTLTSRFRREAELLARLDHPGICAVHDVELEHETPFLAMRLVRGRSLDQHIEDARVAGEPLVHPGTTRDAEPPLGTLLRYIEACARALHVAHESGLVHRDIKPGNLMVTPDGDPVILDFGLAQDESGPAGPMTLTGQVLGTPAYIAPELLRGGHGGADRRADVYSLGVTLYECACLERPFSAPTSDALFHKILHDPPVDLRRRNPALPRDLAVVVHTAIERDPERRYRTALDFAEDLRRIRMREPVHARRPGATLRFARFLQRNPVPAAAVGVVILALTTALFLTNHALDVASDERDAKESTLEELNEFLGLADAQVLQHLRRERLELRFTAGAADTAAFFAKADALLAGLPRHRQALAELRERAEPYSAAAKAADRARNRSDHPEVATRFDARREEQGEAAVPEPELAERHTWDFATPADQWRHATLVRLISDLQAFAPEVARARTLWDAALQNERRAQDADLEAWRRTIEDIAAAPAYGGLRLAPQPGLLPLGRDPASQLFEFVHLASGTVPARDPATGALRIDDGTGIVLVLLPGGRCRLGASRAERSPHHDPAAKDSEGPVHEVTLRPFLIGKHEVTQGQYSRLADGNPSYFPAARKVRGETITLAHPVEWVTWEQATRFLGGHGLELPTEAQWEYALRGGSTTPFWTGPDAKGLQGTLNAFDKTGHQGGVRDDAEPDLWLDDGRARHAPVGSYRANRFGLHDMLGNVSEWCRDVYHPYSTPARDGDGLRGEQTGERHCVRGGSFYHPASGMRSARRGGMAEFYGLNLGFRAAWRLRD